MVMEQFSLEIDEQVNHVKHKDSLFISVNNNIIRNYFSLGKIYVNLAIENLSLPDFSDFIDDYSIVFSPVYESTSNSVFEDETVYPILLEVSREYLNECDVFSLDYKNKLRKIKLKNYSHNKHKRVYYFGDLSLSFIRKIIFRNEEELNRLSISALYNIPNYTNIYFVDEDAFLSSQLAEKYSLSNITFEIGSIREIVDESIRNDRLKAMIYSLIVLNPSVVDHTSINLTKEKLDLLDVRVTPKDFDNLVLHLTSQSPNLLSEKGYQDFKKHLLVKKSESSWYKGLVNMKCIFAKDTGQIIDNIFLLENISDKQKVHLLYFCLALNYLVNHKVFESLQERDFLNWILKVIQSVHLDSTEKSKIIKEIQYLEKDVLSNRENNKDMLLDKDKSSITKAIGFYIKTPNISDFDSIIKNIKHFEIESEIAMLLLLLYTAKNGMAAYKADFKKNLEVNTYIDFIVEETLRKGSTMYKSLKRILNEKNDFQKFYPISDMIPLLVRRSKTKLFVSSEDVRKVLLQKLINIKNKDQLRVDNFFISNILNLPTAITFTLTIENPFGYKVTEDQNIEFESLGSSNMHVVFSYSNLMKVLESDEEFFKYYRVDQNFWNNFLKEIR